MTTLQILFLALVFIAVVSGYIGIYNLVRPEAARQRLVELEGEAQARPAVSGRFLNWAARVTRPASRLSMPGEGFERSRIRLRFVHAGIRNPSAPAAFFGVKTVLALGLPMLGMVLNALGTAPIKGNNLLFALLVLGTVGYYLPNVVLGRLVKLRQREIFETFPDALDLMTVCVEAGLSTESAMMRVAEDLHFKSPALADEMRLVNLELRAGANREHALRNLAIRTGVDEVDGFVTMISQAERFGTSIAASLRVHSDMLRTRRRQRAEETAAKIALKLLFPLIFCIFPSLLLVLMGPAMIQIYRVLLPSMGAH